jgi:ABC-2 type transport system ATP-binding protein
MQSAENKNYFSETKTHFQSGNPVLGFRRFLDLALEVNTNDIEKKEIMSICDSFNNSFDTNTIPTAELINRVLAMDEAYRNRLIPTALSGIPISSANNISKIYAGGNFRLESINMDISGGELIGIVGENGNGKTTLLRIMAADLSKDTGEIEYNFEDNSSLFDCKRQIAYIPQRIPRWYGKLKNNLHFAAAGRGVLGFENEFLVTVMISRLGLSKYKDLYWTQISGGYRTRFELARILLLQPRLLVLDEPLANLDINAQQTFLQDLRYLAKSGKNPLGVIFSSQQLHEVEKVADHIVFLRAGKSVYNSTTDQSDKLDKHTEVELETDLDREMILGCLKDIPDISVMSHGGLFILRCGLETPASQILKKLVEQNVPINYFRNLTHSTKKFFNEN